MEDDIFISSTGPCPESEVLRRIEPLTSDEKFRALQNARSALKTENPYFMVAMQASYVRSALFLVSFQLKIHIIITTST